MDGGKAANKGQLGDYCTNPRLPHRPKLAQGAERWLGLQTGRASGTQNSRLDSGCERRLKDSSKALGLVNGRRALLLI